MSSNLSFSLSVPGKIILIGEHSVLYKKLGVAASISKRTSVVFEERCDSDCIEINFKTLKFQKKWPLETIKTATSVHKDLISGPKFSLGNPELIKHEQLCKVLRETFLSSSDNLKDSEKYAIIGLFYVMSGMIWGVDIDIKPFYLEVSSEISIGAGTGSSAAFSVSIAAAFYHYIKLKLSQKYGSCEKNVSRSDFDPFYMDLSEEYDSFSFKDKEIINKWAYCIEKIMHGTPSGLDNTVCTYGNVVQINPKQSLNEGVKFEPLQGIPALRVLLINTNVPRSTLELVKKVSQFQKLCPIAVDSVLNTMDTVAVEFIQLLQDLREVNTPSETKEIYHKLEGLIDIQQGLLCTLGVSHPRLDEICWITKRRGLHSKLTGAGGGGFAFTLIPPSTNQDVVSQCISDLVCSGFQVEDVFINSKGLTLNSAVSLGIM